MFTLVRGHRQDDGFRVLERIVVHIDILDCLAHAGNHGCKVLDVAHLLHLLDLLVEVPEGEFVLRELLAELARLLLVELLLGFFHEGNHIAHSQDTVCNAFRMEDVQSLHLFSRGNELDGFSNDGLDGKGSTAAGIAVHLGEHNPVEVQPLVEDAGSFHCILAGHCVNCQQDLCGCNSIFDAEQFIHEFLINM